MKNKKKTLLFVFSMLLMLFSAHAQVDSLSVKPLLVPQDSIPASYEWTARSPLSEEERKQREDNRAEVESMKRRFREFHETSSRKKEEEVKSLEDQNYLWTEEENETIKPNPNSSDIPTATDTESLRMEINESFQRHPVQDQLNTPREKAVNSNQFERTEAGWEKQAFQKSPPISDDGWDLKLDERTKELLPQWKLGQSLILEEIQFGENPVELSNRAKAALSVWGNRLKDYPSLKIEVRSHAHLSMSYTEALEITAQRARAIHTYLTNFQIAEQQVLFRGYGKLLPLFSDSDRDNQQKNERIEVIILEMPNR